MEKIIFTRERAECNLKRHFDKQSKCVYRKGRYLCSMLPYLQVPGLTFKTGGFEKWQEFVFLKEPTMWGLPSAIPSFSLPHLPLTFYFK